MKSHRAFPPGRGNLKIPTSSRRATRAGLALYAPCRPKGQLIRWFAWRSVGLCGPRVLPGRPVEWLPPMETGIWEELSSGWRGSVGRFNGLAIHERSQASRRGFAALLLLDGDPVGFVKVRDGDGEPVQNEFRALEALRFSRPSAFEVPEPLAVGTIEGWDYLVTTALAPSLHRVPSAPPIEDILADVRAGLAALPRSNVLPEHWQPMHGDFTPWNLRQRRDGTRFLIDWEDASWAPPGADATFYWAVSSVLGRPGNDPDGSDEVISFWRARLEARQKRSATAGDLDAGLGEALLSVLDVMKNRQQHQR
jgi:hypothetical protein